MGKGGRRLMLAGILSTPVAYAGLIEIYLYWREREMEAAREAELLARAADDIHAAEGLGPLRTSAAASPDAPTLHVLFVGNSFTYYNDMPAMLVSCAGSDPGARVRLAVQSVTRAAARMARQQYDPLVRSALRSRRWDCVVVQEHSMWAADEGLAEQTYAAAKAWRDVLAASAGTLALFKGWAYKPGGPMYLDPGVAAVVGDHARMQAAIDERSPILARLLGAELVPVGDYWERARIEAPAIDLYDPDGLHPSLAGSYLTAQLFYRFLTGRPPLSASWCPERLSPNVAAELRRVASG